MIVVCQHCETRYSVADEKVKGNRFLARCTRCGNIFSAYRPVSVQQIEFLDFSGARKADRNHIIAVSNQKGGVAKTSTTLNVGAALAAAEKKVLLVDFDIQANLSLSLGVREGRCFYDVVQAREKSLATAVCPTSVPNLSLLPSNKGMKLTQHRIGRGRRASRTIVIHSCCAAYARRSTDRGYSPDGGDPCRLTGTR